MTTKQITVNDVLSTKAAKTLYNHINENRNGLVGCQWVVAELIDLRDSPLTNDLVMKIIGTTDENKTVSAPINYFERRYFCGIVYHHEEWTNRPDTIANVKAIAATTGNQFCFYNPYQNKVKFIK